MYQKTARPYFRKADVNIASRTDLEARRRRDPEFKLYSRLYLSGQIGIDEVPAVYRTALLNYEVFTTVSPIAAGTLLQRVKAKKFPKSAPDARWRRSTDSGAGSAL